MADLHVIATVFNPAGFASRYRLYHEFAERMEKRGVCFHTIELAIGDEPFAVTDRSNTRHYQVRTNDPIWYKENLVNVAIKKLPNDWEYVAWVDADIQFARPDWPQATIAKLKDHPFVQMFSSVIDLGPRYGTISSQNSFAFLYPKVSRARAAGTFFPVWPVQGQPGYAWAARRKELEAVGGLFDWAIIGNGDNLMAMGLTGGISDQVTVGLSPAYIQSLYEWQDLCETHIRRNIGHVDDMIQHYWHGRRKDRAYRVREKILQSNEFDPATDLKRDADGLLHLAGNKPVLRQQIDEYFQARDEDSVEV